jgi:membrane dipeptidase
VKILNKRLIIDAHADTLLKRYLEPQNRLLSTSKQEYHITKEFLREGGVNVQTFAMFTLPKMEKFAVEVTLEMISIAKKMEKEEGFSLIQSLADIDKVISIENDIIGMILSIEGAEVFERNLNFLPIFYELGVRMIGLCWSRPNLFGEGVSFKSKKKGRGLSKEGRLLIEEMEDLNMVIDLAHLNLEGYKDVAKYSTKPFIDSHSNAYSICPVSRNLTDDQLEMIASADGVVGVNFSPAFLSKDLYQASITDVISHIRYIANKVGIQHVGLGSDFDGIAMTPKGLENATKMSEIPILLKEDGFSEKDIDKVLGENFLRVLKKNWS